jgi:hypothetical protein
VGSAGAASLGAAATVGFASTVAASFVGVGLGPQAESSKLKINRLAKITLSFFIFSSP